MTLVLSYDDMYFVEIMAPLINFSGSPQNFYSDPSGDFGAELEIPKRDPLRIHMKNVNTAFGQLA